MSRRVKVAGVKRRLSKGTLSANHEAGAAKTVGRPRKDPRQKAKAVTVTLWPGEYDDLEQLRKEVGRGLPTEIPRSDLARLAFALLFELESEEVLRRLVELKRRSQ